jgi:hypothetical protein
MTLLISRRSSTLALSAIVGLYLALGGLYAATTPAFEKPDEEWHFAYVTYLLDRGALPPITSDEALNPARQEAGQPPLFYALSAAAVKFAGLTQARPVLRPNPYWAYPVPGTVNDNKNRFIHERDEITRREFLAVYGLRGLSLLLGVGTVLWAYGLMIELTHQRSLALVSAACVAVWPQYLFIAGSVSNDALVASLSGAAVWVLIRALESRPRSWLAFGALSGLAALAKTSGLVLPALGMAFAIVAGVQRRSVRTALAGTLASLGGLTALAGWWYVRNLWRSGDPLGIGIHVLDMGRAQPLPWTQLASQWEVVEITFWAAFGWTNVLLPDWAYVILRLIEVMIAVGTLFALRDYLRSSGRRYAYAVMTACVAGFGVALVWWARTLNASLGRLLFPALAPLSALIVLACARLGSKLPGLVLICLAGLALIAPVYILPAYQPPRLRPIGEAPRGAQPSQIDFGDLARLYAFKVSPDRVAPGEHVIVTLCWEGRNTTTTDYSIFVHLLGPANLVIGQRNTYPGLGAYATSLWRPGDAFCDQYTVPVSSDAPGSAVYAVEVGLFNLGTGERLPAADAAGRRLGLVTVGGVKVTGSSAGFPPAASRLQANFADLITLIGYEAGPAHPGESWPITLYWQARAPLFADYTVFLHLLDDGGRIVAQGDAPPQAGRYPTHWWDPGEVIRDPHVVSLPADLPSGPYRLVVGLYLPETEERLPLVGLGGDTVMVETLHVAP